MSRSQALADELKLIIRRAAKPTALEELADCVPTFSTFHQVTQAGGLADDERVDFILYTLIPELSARLERGRMPMAIRELLKWRDDDGDPQSLTTRYHKAAAQLQVSGANFERRWEPKILTECAGAFLRFDVEDRRRAAPPASDGAAPLSPTDPCVGLVSLYRRLDERKFAEAMQDAATIAILNTYIPELSVYERALRRALANGAHVQILLLHYDSSAAALRSASMAEGGADVLYEENRIRLGIRHNLAILAALADALDDGARERLRVALYDSLPSLAIYRIDDHALVSVFLHGQLAVDAPQMVISGRDSLLGDKVFGEFDTLWSIAHVIEDLRTWDDSDGGHTA